MCTYQTEKVEVRGSGKGPRGWFSVSEATVYFDHPVHAPLTHSVNVDFLDISGTSVERVAVELDAASARAVAEAILATLDSASPALLESAAAR